MADNRLNVKSLFPEKKKKRKKRKKIEIHVFDSALKTLWENDLNGSDRRLY